MKEFKLSSPFKPEAVSSEKSIELPDNAFSLIKNITTGDWEVINIKFDPVTKTVGQLEIVSKEKERSVAQERFKILVANNVFNKVF